MRGLMKIDDDKWIRPDKIEAVWLSPSPWRWQFLISGRWIMGGEFADRESAMEWFIRTWGENRPVEEWM